MMITLNDDDDDDDVDDDKDDFERKAMVSHSVLNFNSKTQTCPLIPSPTAGSVSPSPPPPHVSTHPNKHSLSRPTLLHAIITQVGRGYHQRRHFLRVKVVVVQLQRYARGYSKKQEFGKMKKSALALQRHGRGHSQRKAYKVLKVKNTAAKVLTNFAMGWSVRHRLPAEWKLRIAAAGEAVRARKRLELKAALFVQSLWRMYKQRKEFVSARKRIVMIQNRQRARKGLEKVLALRRNKKEQDSAVKMQASIRMRAGKKHVAALRQTKKELDSAIKIQSVVRMRAGKKKVAAMKQSKKELESSVKIQSAVRMRAGKKQVAAVRREKLELKSALLIQTQLRMWLAKKKVALLRQAKKNEESTIKMQSVVRMLLGKRKVAALRQAKKEKLAATKIQAYVRMKQAWLSWQATRKACAVISLRIRMKLARQRIKHVKVEQLLTFQLKIIQGVQTNRMLPDVS